jgi:acyl-CoA hydrolase
MRGSPALAYVPSRLSLVPELLSSALVPDLVLLHCSRPHLGKVSLGTEVNVLPAAVEAARARGGLVLAQLNGRNRVAAVRGRTERQQARALIGVAHPDVREELAEEARYLGIG